MKSSWVISAVLLLGGCAADASGSGSGRQGSGVNGGGAGSSAGVGTAGNGFGNGTAGTAGTAGTTGMLADGGICEPGKFCKPVVPDANNCGTLTLKAEVKSVETGNVLVIFDRSGSMMDSWNGMPKWQAGGTALINALQPIASKITIGAEMFPSPQFGMGGVMCMPYYDANPACANVMSSNTGCNVNPITSPDEVNFKPGAMAVSELMTGGAGGGPKYAPVMGGTTPTSEGVAAADMALSGANLVGKVAVVLITDGEPNCMWNQAATVGIIGNWLTKGIKTYVIGLPGANSGNGPTILNALAAAGGTMKYLTPSDTMGLQTKLNEIVSQTLSVAFDSCSIHLNPVADVPAKLQLVVKDKGVDQNVPHMFMGQTTPSWTISNDGASVELLGQLCTDVKGGRFSEIKFTYGCKDLPILPPPT